jgi:hypothetical protein
MESERGYNTTLPRPGIHLRRELIFAERKFVATPLSCGLHIAGAQSLMASMCQQTSSAQRRCSSSRQVICRI